VRNVTRILGWSFIVAILAAAAVAVGRIALARFAGEPGAASVQHGSFDSWPVVPPAPDRPAPNGSRVPAGT
jgi:hypothetical protein